MEGFADSHIVSSIFMGNGTSSESIRENLFTRQMTKGSMITNAFYITLKPYVKEIYSIIDQNSW